jgi:hypothetical protein
MESSMMVPQNKKIELPCDLESPLLDVFPEELKAISKRYLHTYLGTMSI